MIILSLGTSACSFSYVVCTQPNTSATNDVKEQELSTAPVRHEGPHTRTHQQQQSQFWMAYPRHLAVLTSPEIGTICWERLLIDDELKPSSPQTRPYSGFSPQLMSLLSSCSVSFSEIKGCWWGVPCRRGPGCSPSPSSFPWTTSAMPQGSRCQLEAQYVPCSSTQKLPLQKSSCCFDNTLSSLWLSAFLQIHIQGYKPSRRPSSFHPAC